VSFYSEYQYSRDLRRAFKDLPKDLWCKVFDPSSEHNCYKFAAESADTWANQVQQYQAAIPLLPLPWLKRKEAAAREGMISAERRLALDLTTHAQQIMLAGRGIDYFIETPELADLLVASVGEFTADLLDVLVEARHTAFVIHPPKPRPAVLVGLMTIHGASFAVFNDRNVTGGMVFLSPRAFRRNHRLTTEEWGVRLAIGLALYMRTFPHAVRDGLPQEFHRPLEYQGGQCASIRLAEQLIDRLGPVPHPRRCVWRFLRSERFTHKRGQYVFVIPCYINGKAKVVLEVER
jgi:hypothetical protein